MRPIATLAVFVALTLLGCASVHEAREPRPALACFENRSEGVWVVLQDGDAGSPSCTRLDIEARSGTFMSLLPDIEAEGPLAVGNAYWVPRACMDVDPTFFTSDVFVFAEGGTGRIVSTETRVSLVDVRLEFPDLPGGTPGPGEVEVYAVDLAFDERCPMR